MTLYHMSDFLKPNDMIEKKAPSFFSAMYTVLMQYIHCDVMRLLSVLHLSSFFETWLVYLGFMSSLSCIFAYIETYIENR